MEQANLPEEGIAAHLVHEKHDVTVQQPGASAAQGTRKHVCGRVFRPRPEEAMYFGIGDKIAQEKIIVATRHSEDQPIRLQLRQLVHNITSIACNTRPTSPPTRVPFMRMNCRSRPTAPS